MKMGSKILIGCIVVLTILSLSATFYKTVILQDFEITGTWIEFPTEDSSYVWFVYNNEEYELELETSNYDEILIAVSEELGVAPEDLDPDFVAYLEEAYANAEVTGEEEEGESDEESEEMTDEESEEGDAVDAEEVIDDEASSTDASLEESDSEASVEDQTLIDSDILETETEVTSE